MFPKRRRGKREIPDLIPLTLFRSVRSFAMPHPLSPKKQQDRHSVDRSDTKAEERS